MLFRRKTRKDRVREAVGRVLSPRRVVAVVGGLAALAAASSGISAARRRDQEGATAA